MRLDGGVGDGGEAPRRVGVSRDGAAGVALALAFLAGFWVADPLLTTGRRPVRSGGRGRR